MCKGLESPEMIENYLTIFSVIVTIDLAGPNFDIEI